MAQLLRVADEQALPKPLPVLLDAAPITQPDLAVHHELDSASRITFLNPRIGTQRFDTQSVSLGQRLATHGLENVECLVGVARIQRQCGRVCVPKLAELGAAWHRYSAKRIAGSNGVAGIKPLLNGKQGQAIALQLTGFGRKTNVYPSGVVVIAIRGQPLRTSIL